ncbi:Uncharacterised protein [Clostridioides difficile]|uniref:hypothetical protein n=1 Tax=Clostridioides TaxID=1870884 RepID=UPI00038CF1A4|nr:hypothetical protein [Clostridioides difficile]EQK05174.1 hypothetical protein QUI_2400 [Clostridioides difficile P59]MCI4721999.1 hypothetical protein [Clostridioides difficile]MCK3745760.1 hypothetical protein [Clostridioides difficile]MDS6221876.1 hypothetical protein [Clostridioides difficile]VHS74931.1 Uncharacterised protein [Clostridioides difficile]
MKENNRIVSVGTESDMDLTAKELNMIDDFKKVMNGVNNEIANDYGLLEIDRDILDKIALSTALNYKKMNFEYSEIDEKLFDDFTFEFIIKFFGDIEEDELIKYLVYIGEESYELNDREKIFYKIVDTLDTIADIKIADQNKIEKEVGMCIGEDNYITYCINEDLIKFYIKDEEELVIDKNSILLYMLDILFYEVHEE